jgi:pimeloyl-ACP methyl ester carboxylesterase
MVHAMLSATRYTYGLPRYVYLHGFASSPLSRKAQFFRSHLAELDVPLEIPAMDEGDFEHLTISRQVDLITRTVAGEPAILIGSSMGGYVAALYASIHPEVERIVLMAPAFGFASRWVETFGEQAVREWRERGHTDVYHYGVSETRRLSADLLYDAARHPEFPRCDQPTLVFHGISDAIVPAEASRRWVRENPQAALIELESDHELLNTLEAIWQHSAGFLCPSAMLKG